MSRCPRCSACAGMWDMSNCRFCNYPGEDIREGTPEQLKRRDYLREIEVRVTPGGGDIFSDDINRECKQLILRIAEIVESNQTPSEAMKQLRETDLEQIKDIILREGDYDE